MSWYNPLTWFKKEKLNINEEISTKEINKPYRKNSDTTKITKQMYDFILEAKKQQEVHNIFYGRNGNQPYETTEELCTYINMSLNTNFSRSKITKVWTGKLNREELPEGNPIHIPF